MDFSPGARAVDGSRPGDIAPASIVLEAIDFSDAICSEQAHLITIVVQSNAGLVTEEEQKSPPRQQRAGRNDIGLASTFTIINQPTTEVHACVIGIEQLDVFVLKISHTIAIEVDGVRAGQHLVQGDGAKGCGRGRGLLPCRDGHPEMICSIGSCARNIKADTVWRLGDTLLGADT